MNNMVKMWHPDATEPIEVLITQVENARLNGWSEKPTGGRKAKKDDDKE